MCLKLKKIQKVIWGLIIIFIIQNFTRPSFSLVINITRNFGTYNSPGNISSVQILWTNKKNVFSLLFQFQGEPGSVVLTLGKETELWTCYGLHRSPLEGSLYPYWLLYFLTDSPTLEFHVFYVNWKQLEARKYNTHSFPGDLAPSRSSKHVYQVNKISTLH